MNKYIVLALVSSCLSIYADETLMNYDPNKGYLVVFRYILENGNKENPTVKIGAAKAKLVKPTPPKIGKPMPQDANKLEIKPTKEFHKYDGKGKLYAIGVYKEGVNRPSMVYWDRTDVDWPLYSHKVSTDKKNIVFEIYGPRPEGFKVEWKP